MQRVLTRRELNRALLARQGLLERRSVPAAAVVEELVGLQAQVPLNPYVALWSRIEDFDPFELSEQVADGRAVRAGTLRGTIHLHTARDLLALIPHTRDVMERIAAGQFKREKEAFDVAAAVALGRKLLAAEPRTRAQLAKALKQRWPQADPMVLGLTVTYALDLVQVPPRGRWDATSQATWALTERYLDAEPGGGLGIDALILRYLAAFGPATAADARTWSRFTGLAEVFERLRPQLRTFRDEQGRELFDVADGPLPDPGTPAPPRFLPEYDNVLLSHADRSRIAEPVDHDETFSRGTWIGQVLVDGFLRGFWRLGDDGIELHGFEPRAGDPPGTQEELAAEGERLAAFIRSRPAAPAPARTGRSR